MSQESEQAIPLQIKVDADGYLRRECNACGREFKRRVLVEHGPAPRGGYACPYCGTRASENDRFTSAQREHIAFAAQQLIELPVQREAEAAAFDGDPADFVSKLPEPQPVPPLEEPNDMVARAVDCHPNEAFKIAEDWDDAVHCIYCAARTAPPEA